MRTFIAIFTSLLVLLFVQLSDAAVKKSTYKYEVSTGDVGVIKTSAKTKSLAFQMAGEECFNRRVAQYEALRGPADESRMMDFIDSCANLKW